MGSKKQSNPASAKDVETDTHQDANATNSTQEPHPDKKKGVVKFTLAEDEQAKVDAYVPICDEFLNWQTTKKSSDFAIKTYKDSVYWGQIDNENTKRVGKGVIKYNTGRLYEGSWMNDKR